MLSARAGQEASIEGLEAGADDYLFKPFSAAELLARVRGIVELARLRNHHARWRTALIDSLQEAFFVCDDSGAVIEINTAFTDILGGQTQFMMPGLAAALPHVRAGKMKALAVTGGARHRLLPDTPTFAELGFDGFDGVQWYGIVGPAKMPPEIVKRLNDEINRLLAGTELRERLSAEALDPMPMSPEQFGKYMEEDIARWTRLARERNIRLD